jgi:hypothetical protein
MITDTNYRKQAWTLNTDNGYVSSNYKTQSTYTWPVSGSEKKLVLYAIGPNYQDKPLCKDFSREPLDFDKSFKCFANNYGYDYEVMFFMNSYNDNYEMICNIPGLIKTLHLDSDDMFVFAFAGHGAENLLSLRTALGEKCYIYASDLEKSLKDLSKNNPEIIIILTSCFSHTFLDNLSPTIRSALINCA